MKTIEEIKPLILIADDNPTNIDVLVNTLKNDYRLGVATNGKKAIEYTKKHRPQLILLDIMMPEMDGYEVLDHLKMDPDTQDIAVIFVTAMQETENKTKGFEMGAVDYITKPFFPAEVKARVQTHMSLYSYKTFLELKIQQKTTQLQAANNELKQIQMQIIQKLGKAGEYKDNETGKHVMRVSFFSGILAETLKLDSKFVTLISLCSPMHDLGKIGIPDKILLKPGPLDPEEWEIMKTHSKIGADILKPTFELNDIQRDGLEELDHLKDISAPGLLNFASNIAAYHHEKWDGSGYPDGISGEDIPIEARIVAVVDIFDALTNQRPYKQPFSEEKAFEILRETSGVELDANVVNAFFKVVDKIMAVANDLKD